jgi:hypothetical protein
MINYNLNLIYKLLPGKYKLTAQVRDRGIRVGKTNIRPR